MVKNLLKRGLGLKKSYDIEVAEIVDDETVQEYNDSRIENSYEEALEKSVRARREPLEQNEGVNFIAKVLEREHPLSKDEDAIYLLNGEISERGSSTIPRIQSTWGEGEYHSRDDINRKAIRLGERARKRDLSDDKYLKGSFIQSVQGTGIGAIPAWKVNIDEVKELDGENFNNLTYEEIKEEL